MFPDGAGGGDHIESKLHSREGAGAGREGKKVLLKRSRIPSLMAKHTRTNGDKGKEGVASWYGFKMCLAA